MRPKAGFAQANAVKDAPFRFFPITAFIPHGLIPSNRMGIIRRELLRELLRFDYLQYKATLLRNLMFDSFLDRRHKSFVFNSGVFDFRQIGQ